VTKSQWAIAGWVLTVRVARKGHKVALAPVRLAELDAAGRGNRVLVLEAALVAGGDGRLVGVLAGGGAVVLASVPGAVG
jgi:3-dehydroquinate synthase class II